MQYYNKMFYSPVEEGDVIYVEDYKKYFLVEGKEPLGLYVKDFGAITAGSKKEKQELAEIYPPRGFIVFARLLPMTSNMAVYVRVAREAMRGALKNATYYLTDYIYNNVEYHTLSEVWILADDKFYVDVENQGASDLSESKLMIIGWLYKVREVGEDEASSRNILRIRVMPIATGSTTQ